MEEIPKPDPIPPLRVGLTYNLKKHVTAEAVDFEAEYDNMETIAALESSLTELGCRVELMEANQDLLPKLLNTPVDIVFNIAEGVQGRGREAQVPAILNFLRIPFAGSDETTLCIALDKALCNRVLASYGIRTPIDRVLLKDRPDFTGEFAFPAIVKPNAEGSSKGITNLAVVRDLDELRSLVRRNMDLYGQDMLVEQYIPGREFTVAVVGNGEDKRIFPPMEIIHLRNCGEYNIYSYQVKQESMTIIRYDCPADLPADVERDIMDTAARIYDLLGCRDFSRMDFRLSPDNEPYFIEINPLPGMAPGYSDFPMIAEKCGVGYTELVGLILGSALRRLGMPSHW